MIESEVLKILNIEEISNENTENIKYTEWVSLPNNTYIPTTKTVICEKLPPGRYDISYDNSNNCWAFQREEILTDELLIFPNKIFDSIISDINYFWDNRELFDKYQFTRKRGILLYGPPGCGKSSITALLSKAVMDRKGIIFSIKNSLDLNNYLDAIPHVLRVIEPTTPILNIFEDLDGLFDIPENEISLLNVLDGIGQLNDIVNVGCTNYPEELKERILNRPSRFDRRYLIDYLDAANRKFYFKNKILKDDLKKIDLDDLVKKTEGFSLAHLSEVIKSIFIFNKSVNDTIGELKNMGEYINSSKFTNKSQSQQVGFLKK